MRHVLLAADHTGSVHSTGAAATTATAVAAEAEAKLWILSDLQILHRLKQPVVVLTCQASPRYSYS